LIWKCFNQRGSGGQKLESFHQGNLFPHQKRRPFEESLQDDESCQWRAKAIGRKFETLRLTVTRYQAVHTVLSCLMFNLPLKKSTHQRKTASHGWRNLFQSGGGAHVQVKKCRKIMWFKLATVTSQALKYDAINFFQHV